MQRPRRSGEQHRGSLFFGCVRARPSGVATPDPERRRGSSRAPVSAFRSFVSAEAGEAPERQRESWDGSVFKSPKLLLSTRFTLTTHICLQGPARDNRMDSPSKQGDISNKEKRKTGMQTSCVNPTRAPTTVSYQRGEPMSDSGCAWTALPFSSLSPPLPCSLSPPQSFAPWARPDR